MRKTVSAFLVAFPMALAALSLCTAIASAQIAATSAKSYANPAAHRTKRFLITDFGAVADGKTGNTKAIQAAIDKCAANKKGGIVVVPKGTFLSGAIFLKQGVNLLLEKDGVLKGTTNPDDYPQVQTRWEGTEEMWHLGLRQRLQRHRSHHLRRGRHRRIGRGVATEESLSSTRAARCRSCYCRSRGPSASASAARNLPRPSPPGRHPERQGCAHHRCHPGAPGSVVPLHPLQPEC